ncbi:hypothetical protein BKA70DRAFT_1159527, partial [Coprinopsis sp. MPI-PUGE-AT-0042]
MLYPCPSSLATRPHHSSHGLLLKNERVGIVLPSTRAHAQPHTVLPTDVLREIFMFCLSCDRFPSVDSLEAPLLLTQICRDWRLLVLNTPTLWNRIDIPIPTLHLVYGSQRVSSPANPQAAFKKAGILFGEALSTWLTRTGGCHLSFTIRQDDNYEAQEDEICRRVLSILLRKSQSWKSVKLHCPLRNMEAVIQRSSDQFGQLEALEVNCTSRSKLDEPPKLVPLFPFPIYTAAGSNPDLTCWTTSGAFEAPSLRSLSLTPLDEPIDSLNVAWGQLTQLVIEKQGWFADYGPIESSLFLDIPALVRLLRQCSQLERLRVALTPCSRPPDPDQEELLSPLVLPMLTTLEFNEDRNSSFRFFDVLEAPSLRNLEFQTLLKPQHTMLPWSPFPFLERQGNQIEELTIDYRYVAKEYRGARMFEHLGGLKRLNLKGSQFFRVTYENHNNDLLPFGDQDLMSLTTVPTGTGETWEEVLAVLCPNLERIEAAGEHSRLSDLALVQFLQQTRERESTVALAATCITTPEEKATVEGIFQRYREQGFRLDV